MPELADFLPRFKQEPEKKEVAIVKEKEKVIDIFAAMTESEKKEVNHMTIVETIHIPTITSGDVNTPQKPSEQKSELAEGVLQSPDPIAIDSTNMKARNAEVRINTNEETPNIAAPLKEKKITHYPHKYKFGKQIEILEREDVIKTFEVSTVAHSLMESAYFWLMDYGMIRAHEGYNVKVSDCKLVPEGISIDFHRGKHSHQTPPLTLRKDWYGIDKLIAWYNVRLTAKASIKAIYTYSTERGAPIIEEKIINGEIGVKKTYPKGVSHMTRTLVKDVWLFPHIQKNTARRIMKAGYGNEKYYVHYSRLKGISSLCASPKASILSVRSVTGLSARTVEIYLGTSKKAANQAMDIIDEQIKGNA
jgi:hypothetical protein